MDTKMYGVIFNFFFCCYYYYEDISSMKSSGINWLIKWDFYFIKTNIDFQSQEFQSFAEENMWKLVIWMPYFVMSFRNMCYYTYTPSYNYELFLLILNINNLPKVLINIFTSLLLILKYIFKPSFVLLY